MKLFSRFQGRLVVKIDWFDNLFFHRQPQAASFIFIFLDSRCRNPENTLRHEYGHCVQLRMLGLFRYIKYVAVPSVRGFRQRMTTAQYYSQPWEYVADQFGGAIRFSYEADAASRAWEYWNRAKGKRKIK